MSNIDFEKEPCLRDLDDGGDGVNPIWNNSGFGDVIESITKAVGIKKCDGCEERRKKINSVLPWPKKK